jgi:hypothetical protein
VQNIKNKVIIVIIFITKYNSQTSARLSLRLSVSRIPPKGVLQKKIGENKIYSSWRDNPRKFCMCEFEKSKFISHYFLHKRDTGTETIISTTSCSVLTMVTKLHIYVFNTIKCRIKSSVLQLYACEIPETGHFLWDCNSIYSACPHELYSEVPKDNTCERKHV